MNGMLLQLGSEGITLKKEKKKGTVAGKDLKELLELLQGMQDLEKTLFRKGIPFEKYLAAIDGKKGNPVYLVRVLEDASETFLYSDEELKNFTAKFKPKTAPKKEEAPKEKETKEKDSKEKKPKEKEEEEAETGQPAALPYELVEIFEAKEFEKAQKRLAKYDFDLTDFLGKEGELFELTAGSKESKVKSLTAVLEKVKETAKDGMSIQRYKGLGEMNPEQLWETTMNPATRTVLRVTLEDVIEADEMFTVLMGDQVEPRRQFIERHAKAVRNLDV
jgi:DNA gyrase subunit B